MGTYIFAAPSGTTDYVVLDNPVADISVGDDNTFQIQTTTKVKPRSLVGVPGTPFGGIVDEVESSSNSPEYTLKGRTWPGVLSDCVVMPPAGKTNLTASGTVDSCAKAILSAANWPFGVQWKDETNEVYDITINRFVTAKDAIDMLMSLIRKGTNGYEITTSKQTVRLSPVFHSYSSSTISIVSRYDGAQVTRTETTPSVNHLIGLGSGEGTARQICHRYIGRDGEITSTKYYTGPDERTATYDINNDSGSKLIADTEKKLKEYIKPDVVEIKTPSGLDSGIHIGTRVAVFPDDLRYFTVVVTGGVFKLDASGNETVTWTAKI